MTLDPGRYSDPGAVQALAEELRRLAPPRELTFMHVCGTHENAIARHGLRRLLPPSVHVIAGPGCPVCVCPPTDIQMAVELCQRPGVTVATFGDMVRVPGRLSLEQARALGGDVRVVLGAHGAVELARREPDREVVLLAVGFETTACTVAAAALADPPNNLSMLVSQRIIPPALDALLALPDLSLDGFLLPGHVLTVTGIEPFEPFARRSGLPAVVAGFEPLDVMMGLQQLTLMAARGRAGAVNGYRRAVRPGGNPAARAAIDRAFEVVDAPWRGLGEIPASGLALRDTGLDARQRFGLVPDPDLPDCLPGCRCGEVMVGRIEPEECGLFGTSCSPMDPRGPCMVSAEGTCRSRYLYREAGHG